MDEAKQGVGQEDTEENHCDDGRDGHARDTPRRQPLDKRQRILAVVVAISVTADRD